MGKDVGCAVFLSSAMVHVCAMSSSVQKGKLKESDMVVLKGKIKLCLLWHWRRGRELLLIV